MENLPVPKRPRDNLFVFISALTVVIILAVAGQPTSNDMTVITAAVVGLLTSSGAGHYLPRPGFPSHR